MTLFKHSWTLIGAVLPFVLICLRWPQILASLHGMLIWRQQNSNQVLPLDAKRRIPSLELTSLREHKSLWTSGRIYELEKRAIFSKQWLYITHQSRFQKPGDYRTYRIAGFSFFIIQGKDDKLRAFHNVCRHRAYAVTKKESGSSTVLGCRYHGWAYDTKGSLIKAPEFDSVPGFEKTANGLWELMLDIRNGMVFANLNATGDVQGLELGGAGLSLNAWKLERMTCLGEWNIDGDFNWKMLVHVGEEEESAEGNVWQRVLEWIRIRPESKVLVIEAIPKSAAKTMLKCTLFGLETRVSEKVLSKVKGRVNADLNMLSSKQRQILRMVDDASDKPRRSLNEIKGLLGRHMTEEAKLGAEIRPAIRNNSVTKDGIADDKCSCAVPPYDPQWLTRIQFVRSLKSLKEHALRISKVFWNGRRSRINMIEVLPEGVVDD